MIRKYHNHKLQTNLWHRGEEPHNNHETTGRQTKQSISKMEINKEIFCFFSKIGKEPDTVAKYLSLHLAGNYVVGLHLRKTDDNTLLMVQKKS